MEYQTLRCEQDARVITLTVNRPEKLNALNREVLLELRHFFEELKTKMDVGAVIITGSGEKAFVAGADISELNPLTPLEGIRFAESGQAVFNLIEQSPVPVIAAVNGFALGGGCELALACHFRYASENAKFGQPEVNLGIIPGYGGTQRLGRLINPGRAAELILTGNMVTAAEALSIGLVNKVLPAETLLEEARKTAALIASKPFHAVKNSLLALGAIQKMTLQEGLAYEASLFGLTCGTKDFKEGTSAFLEKRKPEFSHE